MKKIDHVVIRFSGDSGDGMQITGAQFSSTSASMGNDIATFPDFPAEIRAPQGTLFGVSGFQVHFGSKAVNTPGDEPDVLVAMNPAALKVNLSDLKKGGTIIVNLDAFTDLNLKKAGYDTTPLDTIMLSDYKVIKANITEQTKEALKDLELDQKSKLRSKNFYALGLTYFMYQRDLEPTLSWIETKFSKDKAVMEGNILALKAGYNFGETIEAIADTYVVSPAKIASGKYRQINGNTATAWGFLLAAEKSNLNLFLGSYPITPASDILHELSRRKNFNVKTYQAEDEIAAIGSCIGASFAGALAITTSSGPGIALKSEAMGLAIMYELPLVIVDIQRGGPSTGLPTKTEQSDLNLIMHGRHGESPLIVVAASKPSDCFHMAYEASRLALTHMTPVVLMTDGYIANGSEPWKIPDVEKDYKEIKTKLITKKDEGEEKYLPYRRDPETLARRWAIPGVEGLEHRLGGLEKQVDTGNVSYDPANHELMVKIREDKVRLVQNDIPLQEVEGDQSGDILVVSWGGTYGATHAAVAELREKGKKVSLMHIKYINPMPKNIGEILNNFKKIIVCELNRGQMKDLLNARFNKRVEGYNKVQGRPFKVSELVGMIESHLQ